MNGYFSINDRQFDSLEQDEQDKILDYQLQVYVCSNGTDSEKLEWFRTINIEGEKLSDQELRNATYRGPWLTEAKKHFSKNNNPAQAIGDKYISAKWNATNKLGISAALREELYGDKFSPIIPVINLDYLINKYLTAKISASRNYRYPTLNDLYFLPGGNPDLMQYHKKEFDSVELEKQISLLMQDSEVENKRGIYEFVFDNNQKHLNLRQFDDNIKRTIYEKQGGVCPMCRGTKNENKKWNFDEMEGDHNIPWSKGGKTVEENCVMLCRQHNREKSNK